MKKSILHYSITPSLQAKLFIDIFQDRHLPVRKKSRRGGNSRRRLFVIQFWLRHPQRGERWFIDSRGDI